MERGEREWLVQALREDDVVEVAAKLGFSVTVTPVEGPALRAWGLEAKMVDDVGTLQVLGAEPGFRLLHVAGPGPWRLVRRLMIAVDRAMPEATVLWWWSSPDAWTAALVERDREQRRRVKKLVVEREFPDEVGLMQWLALSSSRRVGDSQCVGAESWARHFSQVLDQDGVTREFFARFSTGLDDLVESMQHGPDDGELRHEVALGTLLRVVFLYFLQARGALDGDRRFVMRRFHESRGAQSFYRAVLRPLFFGALNCPPRDRRDSALELGDLPFLNGGLFEPTAAERAHPDIDWDDQVWRELLEGLFECHRFAVEWSDDNDLCRAVDPEMLGKVFEGLMYGDRRRKSGSFYTPRDVVRSMVKETLSAWFAESAQLEESAATALLDGAAATLSAQERRRAREAMANLSVLDPAVGTGAFLLEILRVLRRVDSGLDAAEGVIRTPGERYDRMRSLVHDHLSGVDIQPTAVRLCELRIWLAMLAALPELPARQMPPLPNLSHRLCTGNSLLDPLDWVRFRVGDESTSFGRPTPIFEGKAVERLAFLQKAYTRAHGAEKLETRRALKQAQHDVELDLTEARIAKVREAMDPLTSLEESEDLFGEPRRLEPAQSRQLQDLRQELAALKKARRDLKAGRRQEAAFSYDAHFAPVMARGGFDVVVTNPPWVRTSRIDRGLRKLYRSRFRGSNHGLWPHAGKLGIRATFGAQIDMAGLFLERSLELLRPGGRLCALVPVKLFRSLHGSALRGILAEHRVEFLEDRADDEEAMFDAATYPAILRVRKADAEQASSPPIDVGVWRSDGATRFRTPLKNLCVVGDDVREPWMLVEPEVEQLFRTMQDASVALGEVEEMPIRGGVKTGCNQAFLLSEEEARRKFSPSVIERYLRWAVRGRDVTGASIERRRRIIWPVDEHGQIAASLPAELEKHFQGYGERLKKRSDYRGGPIWTLFRRHDDVEEPGVVWRDMGEQLEASRIDGASIALNTVYYLPAATDEMAQAIVALFHSEPIRAIAFAIGERARGGWRRHFAWVMRMLPIPRRWLHAWKRGDLRWCCDEREIHRAFGLSSRDIESLSQWRRGPGCSVLREAA